MKKILFIITLIAFAACAKFAPEHSYTSAGTDMTEPVETKEVTICASAPDDSVPALPASKTVLDGNKVKWSAGDVVKISKGEKHKAVALEDMEIIEIQIGDLLIEEDIERFDYQ